MFDVTLSGAKSLYVCIEMLIALHPHCDACVTPFSMTFAIMRKDSQVINFDICQPC